MKTFVPLILPISPSIVVTFSSFNYIDVASFKAAPEVISTANTSSGCIISVVKSGLNVTESLLSLSSVTPKLPQTEFFKVIPNE